MSRESKASRFWHFRRQKFPDQDIITEHDIAVSMKSRYPDQKFLIKDVLLVVKAYLYIALEYVAKENLPFPLINNSGVLYARKKDLTYSRKMKFMTEDGILVKVPYRCEFNPSDYFFLTYEASWRMDNAGQFIYFTPYAGYLLYLVSRKRTLRLPYATGRTLDVYGL